MAVLRNPRLSPLARAAVSLVVLLAVFAFLAVSPAPVTFPDHHWEIVLLVVGGAALLLAHLALARPVPVEKAARARRALTGTEALEALRAYEHFTVSAPDGVIGVVEEALGDRAGRPIGFAVAHGWFGGHRFLVPLGEVAAVDEARRELHVRDSARV